MKENCPENLETLLEFVNPIIFRQVLSEKLPRLASLDLKFPGLSIENLLLISNTGKKDYRQNTLALITFLKYAGKSVGELGKEGLRELVYKKLRQHVERCYKCRNFYLESFLKNQTRFYRQNPKFIECEYEELLKIADFQYLRLMN